MVNPPWAGWIRELGGGLPNPDALFPILSDEGIDALFSE
jgi:hypothetical protein